MPIQSNQSLQRYMKFISEREDHSLPPYRLNIFERKEKLSRKGEKMDYRRLVARVMRKCVLSQNPNVLQDYIVSATTA